MRSVQRVKTLLLTETLLGVARAIKEQPGYETAIFRSEIILSTIRLIAVKLGFAAQMQETGYQFIFKSTRFSGAKKSFEHLNPLIERLLGEGLEPETSRIERAVLLTNLYEQTLNCDFREFEERLQLVDMAHGKRRLGQFYTPLSLARKTVANAFNNLLTAKKKKSVDQLSHLKILDPAMGGGVFLLCALEYMERYCAKTDDARTSTRLATTLYGTDLDPLACEVASIALWIYCASHARTHIIDISDLGKNFRCTDALLSGWSRNEGQIDTAGSAIFLWDKEFPEIFAEQEIEQESISALTQKSRNGVPQPTMGFDIIISNPPWEIAKPNSQEFFTSSSPDFRKLSKQEALVHSRKLLSEQKLIKSNWHKEQLGYRTRAAFLRKASSRRTVEPGLQSEQIRDVERAESLPETSKIQSMQERPLFAAQGDSDLNIYKLFLDLGFALLKTDGCMAMLVPSGVLTDKGALALRKLFLTRGRLHTIETFVNSDRSFAIHPSFAYSLLGVQKGSHTINIKVKFDQQSNSRFSYSQKDISILSPKWLTIFDVSHPKDLEILKKLHNTGVPLGGSSGGKKADWQIKFKREYDMTNDSRHFINVHDAEKDGFRADIYGNWLKGSWQPIAEDELQNDRSHSFRAGQVESADGRSSLQIESLEQVLLPLYEGRMIGQFDYSQKCHLTGSGRTALWLHNPERYPEADDANFIHQLRSSSKSIRPHYLIPLDARNTRVADETLKTGYLAVGSATNVRTMLASALFMVPCGNSVPVLTPDGGIDFSLALTASLNSFVFDYALRMRMTGNNLNYFLLQECPLPLPKVVADDPVIVALTAALNLNHVRNSAQWLELLDKKETTGNVFASSKANRQKLRSIIDALIANSYGLSFEEFSWMLRGCDKSQSHNKTRAVPPYPKGFWREGKNNPPSTRLPVLALELYKELLTAGREPLLEKLRVVPQIKQSEETLSQLRILSTNLHQIVARRS